ncbi:MAG: hypothetical protein E6I40_08945 [Chloroflexi bacterium]|nr:MAG: hypothetical protein E6I40_08945 [Chloroflexota bacterium]
MLLLHEERAHVRAGRVEPRGKSGGTTADDDEIEVGQRRSFPGSSLTLEQLGIPERYLALGDSFTIGTGTTPDRSFPAVLVRLWRESGREVELRNPAVNGYTTDDLIREELPLITAFRPTFATVLIGANDLVAAVRGPDASRDAEQRYARQLVRIFDALAGVDVVALPQPDWSLAPMGGDFGDRAAVAGEIARHNTVMRQVAERAGSRYVDLFPLMRGQAGRGMFAPDGLHPSAEAYGEWAKELAARI